MTRRVWVLPPTGFPGPEGTAGDALDKSKVDGRESGGSRRLRRLRGKAKRPADAGLSDAGLSDAGLSAAPVVTSPPGATDEAS